MSNTGGGQARQLKFLRDFLYIRKMGRIINPILANAEEAEKLERIAYILKTVAHPVRLGVIHLLEQNPRLSVSEICERLGTEQSLTSHHLKNLRLRGLISARREGRSIYYSLKEPPVSLLIDCLEDCNVIM